MDSVLRFNADRKIVAADLIVTKGLGSPIPVVDGRIAERSCPLVVATPAEGLRIDIRGGDSQKRDGHSPHFASLSLVMAAQRLLSLHDQRKALPGLTEKTRELTQTESNKTITSRLRSRRTCLLYTSPSPRDRQKSRMPSSA